MAYERVNWENLPSKNTPINQTNLNKMENGIDQKADSSDVYTKTETDTKLNTKQDKLTAGTGIEITGTNIINNLNANYSTDEQVIGKWIDGKPLYRKVIKTTMVETSQSGTYVNKEVDIGTQIDFGFVENSILIFEGQRMSLPYINNAGYSTKCFVNNNLTLILANSNSTFNNCKTYVILKYTKTTD